MSLAAVLLGFAALHGDLPPPVEADPTTVRALQQESWEGLRAKLGAAIDQERFEEASLLLKALLAHPDSAAMSESARAPFLWLQALLYMQMDRPAAAIPALQSLTASPQATQEHWSALLDAYNRTRNQDGAASTLTEILTRYPDAAQDLYDVFVLQISVYPGLEADTGFRLREALHRSGWVNEDASWVWLKLVDDYIDRGRAAEAGPVVARVSSPSARLQLFAMRRYDPVRPTAATLDIDTAWAREITLARKRADGPDATLEDRNRLASGLFAIDQLAEALGVVDAALAAPEPEAGSPEAEDFTWLLNTRSRILMALNRGDEAVAQQQAAAARSEFGHPNVSQQINLGWTFLRLDRPREAFDAVKDMDEENLSAFGKMQAWQVRACASRGIGDIAAAEAVEATIFEHWKDAPIAAYEAASCREDEAEMARLLIVALGDPETAPDMVDLMHAYLDREPTAWDRRMADRHARVVALPEVIAARDAVGRAFTVPTRGPQF